MPGFLAALGPASSAIGAGAGLFGALSASGDRRAALAAQQNQANVANHIAYQQYLASVAGQTDARGNQSVYDPSTNQFVTITTPETRDLIEASDREELARLTQDAPLARQEYHDNVAQRRQDRGLADALRERFSRTITAPVYDTPATASRRQQALNANQAFDSSERAFLRQGMRSGASGLARALQQSGLARTDALNQIQSTGTYDASDAVRQQNLANSGNLYSTLAAQASNVRPFQFQPNALAAQLQQSQQASRAAGAGNARNALLGTSLGSSALGAGQGLIGFDPTAADYATNLFRSLQRLGGQFFDQPRADRTPNRSGGGAYNHLVMS